MFALWLLGELSDCPWAGTQVEKNCRKIEIMASLVCEKSQWEYVKIEIIHWAPFSHLLSIAVTKKWIFQSKNPRIKMWWKNLWNYLLLKCHHFFWLILYYPGFYSSLSDKKQRNGSILEKILIFHKLYQNCQNYMVIRILCINFPNFFQFFTIFSKIL